EPFLFINGVKLNQLFQRLNNISFIGIDASAIPINQIIARKVIDGQSPDTITFSVKNTKSIGITTFIKRRSSIDCLSNSSSQNSSSPLSVLMARPQPADAFILWSIIRFGDKAVIFMP